MFYLFNGQLKENDDKISVSPYGHGYQYGLGVFETILIEDGKTEFFDEHMDRLMEACEALDIPFRIHKDEVLGAIEDLIRLNRMDIASVKVQVSKTPHGSDLLIFMRELPKRDSVFKLTVSQWKKGSNNPMINYKTTQYSANVLELNKAKEAGFDEVLFFNEKGYLTEGAYTNIFFIDNHKLYTPKLENGLLPGIMRQKIIDAAMILKIECIETDITMEMMKGMASGFLTNSLMGVKAFDAIDDIDYDIHELQTWLIHRVKGQSNG